MDAVVPLVPAGAAPAAWSPLFYAAPQVNRLSVVPHTGVLMDPVAAVLWLIGCSLVLRRLKLICSSPGVKSTCTLSSRVDLDSADGVRAHNFWMYCTENRILILYSYLL